MRPRDGRGARGRPPHLLPPQPRPERLDLVGAQRAHPEVGRAAGQALEHHLSVVQRGGDCGRGGGRGAHGARRWAAGGGRGTRARGGGRGPGRVSCLPPAWWRWPADWEAAGGQRWPHGTGEPQGAKSEIRKTIWGAMQRARKPTLLPALAPAHCRVACKAGRAEGAAHLWEARRRAPGARAGGAGSARRWMRGERGP